MPSGKTGLGQSSLTGLGSELAQNPDSNAVPSRRSAWSFRQRSGGSRSYLLHCRVPAIEAIVTRDATIRANLQDALEVSFHDSAPLDSWRRFPKPPRGRCCFQWMHNGFIDRCSYETVSDGRSTAQLQNATLLSSDHRSEGTTFPQLKFRPLKAAVC